MPYLVDVGTANTVNNLTFTNVSATTTSAPLAGNIWFNTTSATPYIGNGTTWIPVSATPIFPVGNCYTVTTSYTNVPPYEYEPAEKRSRAVRKAQRLLNAALNVTQRTQLKNLGYFEIVGSDGRTYQICKGAIRNVYAVDDLGFRTHRLCAHPTNGCPDGDTMLAQMLMLQCDAESFWKIANAQTIPHPVQCICERCQDPAVIAKQLQEAVDEAAAYLQYAQEVENELRAEGVDPVAFLAELQATGNDMTLTLPLEPAMV